MAKELIMHMINVFQFWDPQILWVKQGIEFTTSLPLTTLPVPDSLGQTPSNKFVAQTCMIFNLENNGN